jgi:hypothetical protein
VVTSTLRIPIFLVSGDEGTIPMLISVVNCWLISEEFLFIFIFDEKIVRLY